MDCQKEVHIELPRMGHLVDMSEMCQIPSRQVPELFDDLPVMIRASQGHKGRRAIVQAYADDSFRAAEDPLPHRPKPILVATQVRCHSIVA